MSTWNCIVFILNSLYNLQLINTVLNQINDRYS